MEVSKPVGYVSVIVLALIAIGITFTNVKVTQMRNEQAIQKPMLKLKMRIN